MIKAFFSFFFLFTIFFCGISYLWHLSGKDKLNYLRLGVYSTLCSVITLVILVGIVILF
jgi:hypothetical protein